MRAQTKLCLDSRFGYGQPPARPQRPAHSVGNRSDCGRIEDFAARAAHRSHLVRSIPGGNRSRSARRSVISAARLTAFSSMVRA